MSTGSAQPTRSSARRPSTGRLVLGAVGVLMGLFGVLRLFRLDASGLLDALAWMVGGALVHDVVVAPLTLLTAWVLRRVVPDSWWARVAAALVVVATVTATAVPVLGRFGAREDNASLLDRPYWLGWLVLVVLVAAVTLLLDPARRALRRPTGRPPRTRRRQP
ncbi:MAG: hypothetical protein JWR42_927 [Marmoricola sp.]|nr:hypothetical protein [Marmoricola sp.]